MRKGDPHICERCHKKYEMNDESGMVDLSAGPVEVSWHVCPACYNDIFEVVTNA